MNVKTKYHRDGTVSVWDVYLQNWTRTANLSDAALASLGRAERERVIQHVQKHDDAVVAEYVERLTR